MPQGVLDEWVVEEKVDLDGPVLRLLGAGHRFRLDAAVAFLAEVGGAGDDAQLIGTVKDLEALAEMGGEHFSDSVILGDAAYQVEEGFVGTPVVTGEDGGDDLGLGRFFGA